MKNYYEIDRTVTVFRLLQVNAYSKLWNSLSCHVPSGVAQEATCVIVLASSESNEMMHQDPWHVNSCIQYTYFQAYLKQHILDRR